MTIWTEQEFEIYKGGDDTLEVRYYGNPKVRNHKTYEDYVESFNELCAQEVDNVEIPRELLLYLQGRVDPQNEYPVWMMINKCLDS